MEKGDSGEVEGGADDERVFVGGPGYGNHRAGPDEGNDGVGGPDEDGVVD